VSLKNVYVKLSINWFEELVLIVSKKMYLSKIYYDLSRIKKIKTVSVVCDIIFTIMKANLTTLSKSIFFICLLGMMTINEQLNTF
jgi:hypothetical protein